MSKTRVVHINDNVPGAIYIGRAVPRKRLKKSFWANPYKVGDLHGGVPDVTLASVLRRYELASRLVLAGANRDVYLGELRKLVGHPLACWCRHDGEERTPENACHADVLIALIEELGLEGEGE